MKNSGFLEAVFYILMIFFGAFLPLTSMVVTLNKLGLSYTPLNTMLALLPGVFIGTFLILFSLTQLGKILT